ncbi:MAG: FAD binding domain-containing protein, partial [Actinomycetota bacterium]
MIPVAFDYVRANTAADALAALAEHGDEAKLLAGGHSLLPMMKLRLAYPSVASLLHTSDSVRWRARVDGSSFEFP